jgi:hypothetical protein
MEDPRGVEPPCRRLRGGCSTVELRVQVRGDQGGFEPPHHRLKGGHSTIELQVRFTRSFDGQTSASCSPHERCGWKESNLQAGHTSPSLPGTPIKVCVAHESSHAGSCRRHRSSSGPSPRRRLDPQKRRRPPRGSRAAFASSWLTNASAALWPILGVPEPRHEAGAQTEGQTAMGKLLANLRIALAAGQDAPRPGRFTRHGGRLILDAIERHQFLSARFLVPFDVPCNQNVHGVVSIFLATGSRPGAGSRRGPPGPPRTGPPRRGLAPAQLEKIRRQDEILAMKLRR